MIKQNLSAAVKYSLSKSIEYKISSTKVSVSNGNVLNTTKYRYFFRDSKYGFFALT